MKIAYAASCDCAERAAWPEDFEPIFLEDERQAARGHLEAELRRQRGDGGRYYAFHVKGRHILYVQLDG